MEKVIEAWELSKWKGYGWKGKSQKIWQVRHFTCSFSWPVEETVGGTKGVCLSLGAGNRQCLSGVCPTAFLFLKWRSGAFIFWWGNRWCLFPVSLFLVLTCGSGAGWGAAGAWVGGGLSCPLMVAAGSIRLWDWWGWLWPVRERRGPGRHCCGQVAAMGWGEMGQMGGGDGAGDRARGPPLEGGGSPEGLTLGLGHPEGLGQRATQTRTGTAHGTLCGGAEKQWEARTEEDGEQGGRRSRRKRLCRDSTLLGGPSALHRQQGGRQDGLWGQGKAGGEARGWNWARGKGRRGVSLSVCLIVCLPVFLNTWIGN